MDMQLNEDEHAAAMLVISFANSNLWKLVELRSMGTAYDNFALASERAQLIRDMHDDKVNKAFKHLIKRGWDDSRLTALSAYLDTPTDSDLFEWLVTGYSFRIRRRQQEPLDVLTSACFTRPQITFEPPH